MQLCNAKRNQSLNIFFLVNSTINGYVGVDNGLYIWIDGGYAGWHHGWTSPFHFSRSSLPRVVAVQADNWGGPALLIAYIREYDIYMSSSNTKCTTSAPSSGECTKNIPKQTSRKKFDY